MRIYTLVVIEQFFPEESIILDGNFSSFELAMLEIKARSSRPKLWRIYCSELDSGFVPIEVWNSWAEEGHKSSVEQFERYEELKR